MTTAYNKRPSARGRVRQSAKTAPTFVEWKAPRNFIFGFLITIFGMAPLAGLTWFDWVSIGGNEDIVGYGISFSMLTMLMSPFAESTLLGETVITALLDTTSFFTYDMAEEFNAWYATFGLVFVGVAAAMVLSLLLTTASAFAGKNKTRSVLAYTGFGMNTLASGVFILTVLAINRTLDIPALVMTPYPFIALLAGILAMVYCVRFPVLSDSSRRKNSLLTRAVTTFVPVKGDGVREGIRKVIFTTALVSFIYYGSTLGVDLLKEWDARRMQSDLLNRADMILEDISDPVFDTIRPLNPRYHLEPYRQNQDTIGFIRVGETAIAYPVVQAADNHFYLCHNFERGRSMGGWPFADFRNRFEGTNISTNTVLYGHSGARREAYFTLVPRYFTTTRDDRNPLSFYRENPIIEFNTLFEQMQWKVFAVVLFNTQAELGTVVPYWNRHDFEDADDFHDFIIDIMDRSVLHTDTDIQYGDHILTLSTCHFHFGKSTASTRVGVFARRLRPGETPESFNIDAATRNRLPYYGDFRMAANAFGTGQRGVWDRNRYLLSYTGG